jgi:Macrocin-O-methyltransferase (TylF)
MTNKHESSVLSFSNQDSLDARHKLFHLLKSYPATEEETERSLGLFLRGSLLARIFATRELYEQIIDLPGIVVDIGTWRGQTAVLCENFRAIFEPLNFNRRIVCFDTFTGYQGFSDVDKATALHKDGTYSVGESYVDYLKALLVLHEQNNAMGHNNGKHKVIAGDCRNTIPQFFKDVPGEVVSLAFFDVNAFDPTKAAFQEVYERTVPQGVIAFWQLSRESMPAEAMVYKQEILGKLRHRIRRSRFYPGLTYIIKE